MALAPESLFDADVPDGFRYEADFLTRDEERSLAQAIARIEFSKFEMRGIVARRRVAFFGRSYDTSTVVPPIPDFLTAVRTKAAAWAGVRPDAFAMALVNEYRPDAPIGWHRDAPQYDIVCGISLLSVCRMKFRPYMRPREQAARGSAPRRATHEVRLQPRSVYLLAGLARSAYEHHIPAVNELRYSITFRTLRL